MLVLSRKLSEEIVIDGHITVKVLRIQGHRVYLGIEAPKEVAIRRGELVANLEPSHDAGAYQTGVNWPTASA